MDGGLAAVPPMALKALPSPGAVVYRSFTILYMARVGLATLSRAIKLASTRQFGKLLSLGQLLSEDAIKVRVTAVRFAVFVAAVGGVYSLVRKYLAKHARKWTSPMLRSVLAGGAAGLTLRMAHPSMRHTIASYVAVRAIRTLASHKVAIDKEARERRDVKSPEPAASFSDLVPSKRWWQRLPAIPSWMVNYGSEILFAATTAQVMYAYAMRPATLPRSYFEFMIHHGPMDEIIGTAVSVNCRNQPLSPSFRDELLQYVVGHGGKIVPNPLATAIPGVIPCSVMHPWTTSCLFQAYKTARDATYSSFPLYLTLASVSTLLFNFKRLLASPLGTAIHVGTGTVRSTAFLATLIATYQAVVCGHRNVFALDHKLLYWFAGAVSAISIFWERKSRRAELALYVLPRAADSAWKILVSRGLARSLPFFDTLLFSFTTAVLFAYNDHAPEHVSGVVKSMLATLYGLRPGVPEDDAPSPRPRSRQRRRLVGGSPDAAALSFDDW